jgi:hypothetical protein
MALRPAWITLWPTRPCHVQPTGAGTTMRGQPTRVTVTDDADEHVNRPGCSSPGSLAPTTAAATSVDRPRAGSTVTCSRAVETRQVESSHQQQPVTADDNEGASRGCCLPRTLGTPISAAATEGIGRVALDPRRVHGGGGTGTTMSASDTQAHIVTDDEDERVSVGCWVRWLRQPITFDATVGDRLRDRLDPHWMPAASVGTTIMGRRDGVGPAVVASARRPSVAMACLTDRRAGRLPEACRIGTLYARISA